MDLGLNSIVKISEALELMSSTGTPRRVQIYYRRTDFMLTSLVSGLPEVCVEAQDKVLHIFCDLLSRGLQRH